jgi:ankyrin repeat protein
MLYLMDYLTHRPHPCQSTEDSMNDLIEQTLKAAADASINTYKSEMSVEVDSATAVENAIRAWGQALGNSRGAPSWSRVEEFVEDLDKERASLKMISDEKASGALLFDFSSTQQKTIGELREFMEGLAQRVGAGDEAISRAKTAFDASIGELRVEEAFVTDMGGLAVSAFLEKTALLAPVVHHEQYGELNAKSLVSLAKVRAPSANPENGDDAVASQLPREMAAPDSAQYVSMGQMVKAGDAMALKKHIEDYKAKGKWDKDREMACDKLVWVAAEAGDIETIRVLARDGGGHVDYGVNGVTPLLVAVAHNHPEVIDCLLAEGASRKETHVDGRTLLMFAASHDAVDSIRKLHELKFDLDEKSIEGRTALHHAALGENESSAANAVKLLLELGADPTIVDEATAEGALAEEYVDEKNDDIYALMSQRRRDWEAGNKGPQSAVSKATSNARKILGF